MSSNQWQTSSGQIGKYHRQTRSKPHSVGKNTLTYLKSMDQGNFVHQQQNIAQKFRHGLFSQPMGISVGDYYQDKKPDQPEKGVSVNQRMQQKVGPELFMKMTSNNIGDPYKDAFRAQQLYNKEKNDMNIHAHAFFAGGKQKLVKNSQFQHKKQYDDKIFNMRGQDGKVITGKKGITTNNMKKGFGNTTAGHLFSHFPYMGDNYDAQKDLESKQKLIHKARIPNPFIRATNQAQTFTPIYVNHQGGEPFSQTKDDQLYRGKSVGNWKYNNPGKKGFNGTFTKFPVYIEQGQKQKKEKANQKVWIPNFNGTSKGLNQTLHKPCPPPSHMVINQLQRQKS